MSNVIAELERRLQEAEDENDALELRLARIENALLDAEPVPAAVVDRLAEGEKPLRVWREHRRLTMREVARRAGISAAMLTEVEAGKKERGILTLAALARVLGVDTDDLIPWLKD
jgi:DNA-binding XRE family transcriptional regulator